MNKQRLILVFGFILSIGLLCNSSVFGQTTTNNVSGDSLTLEKIIAIVVQTHPMVKEAAESVNSANAGIGLAKSGYFPTIDATASYARIGPADKMTFPMLGTFQLYPSDNYAASVNVYENIYDFGKTHRNVNFAKEVKTLNEQSIEQVKQKLAYTATMIYYSMVYLQEAIIINKDQLKTLQEHLDFIQKKHDAGSATQYEILSTQVKISTVESAGIDLQTSLKNQRSELNSLMGQTENTDFAVKEQLNVKLPDVPDDSLISFAYKHRDEIKIAQEKTAVAELRLKVVRAQNHPSLNLELSGGGKNGYFPDLNAVKANYVAAIGLNVPIFEGTRMKYNMLQTKSAIVITNYETELAKRTITADVTENLENIKASLKKIDHFNLQLTQSKQAFALSQTNYQAGAITNLDVLDATTTITESNLLLFKSKVEYVTNVYKLKMAIGERLY